MKVSSLLAVLTLLSAVAISRASNLVANPTFAGGNDYPASGTSYPGYGAVPDYSGTGNFGSNAAGGPFLNGLALPAGDSSVGFLQVGPGTPTSSFSTTLLAPLAAGEAYSYSFLEDVRPGYSNPTLFELEIGDQILYATSTLSTSSNFALVSGTFLSDGSGNVLDFIESGTSQDATVLIDNVSVAATPEPGSLVLLGTGILGLAGAARRRFTR